MSKFTQIIVLFFLNVYVALCNPTEDPNQPSPRIINGQICEIARYPFVVQYYRRKYDYTSMSCGGSLLTYEWVLSAAHCYYTRDHIMETIVVAGTSKYHLRVHQSNGVVRRVNKHVIHPHYSRDVYGVLLNDILLAKVESPFQKDHAWIKPAALPEEGFTSKVMDAVVMGWGQQTRTFIPQAVLQKWPQYFRNLPAINESRPIADTLMCAEVQVAQYDECKKNYPPGFSISPVHICTRPFEQKGPCFGDSGGPLALKNTVIGVVSTVVACGQHSFAIYVRVDQYYDFMRQHIGDTAIPKKSDMGKMKKTRGESTSKATLVAKLEILLVLIPLMFMTGVLVP